MIAVVAIIARYLWLTNGGLSINLRQLFNSVGELSSSELGERDWCVCKFLLSQLLIFRRKRGRQSINWTERDAEGIGLKWKKELTLYWNWKTNGWAVGRWASHGYVPASWLPPPSCAPHEAVYPAFCFKYLCTQRALVYWWKFRVMLSLRCHTDDQLQLTAHSHCSRRCSLISFPFCVHVAVASSFSDTQLFCPTALLSSEFIMQSLIELWRHESWSSGPRHNAVIKFIAILPMGSYILVLQKKQSKVLCVMVENFDANRFYI